MHFSSLLKLLVCGWTGFFLLFFSCFCFAVKADSSVRITLSVKEKPVKDVLSAISASSGYEIILKGEYENRPVSLNLEKVTLKESVKRVLRGFNYASVWDEKGKQIVLIFTQNQGRPDSGNRTKDSGSTVVHPKNRDNGKRSERNDVITKEQNPPLSVNIENVQRKEKRDSVTEQQRSIMSITGRDTHFIQTTRTSMD